MIAANQFLRDEFSSSEENHSRREEAGFVPVSSRSFVWRGPSNENEEDTTVAVGNKTTAIVATMDEFLSQQSTLMKTPMLNSSLATSPQAPPSWLTSLEQTLVVAESTLKNNNGSSSSVLYLTSKFTGESNPVEAPPPQVDISTLSHDRQGVVVSHPLRICATTALFDLLRVSETNGHTTNPSSFCLAALQPRENQTKDAAMDLVAYPMTTSATSKEANTQGDHDDDDYVPPGYEAFGVPPEDGGKSGNENDNNSHNNRVIYIMEIRDTSPGGGCELESVALVFDDNDQENTSSTARRIRIKFMTSKKFLQLVQSQTNPATLINELEQVSGLSLPLAVGLNATHETPSIVVLVTLDSPENFPEENGDTTQEATEPTRVRLIQKFQRQEILLNHAWETKLARSHFCIGHCMRLTTHHHAPPRTKSTLELLEDAARNAERFVPQWKRQQWDSIPHALISIIPHQLTPWNLRNWLMDPAVRRSDFDLALANVLLHLPSSEFQTRQFCYFDKSTLPPQHPLVHHIANIGQSIAFHVQMFKNSTLAASGANLIDALALRDLCVKMDAANGPGQEHCATALRSYIHRMLTAVKIERLCCLEDMKKHDMYSILWDKHTIAIAPPLIKRQCSYCCGYGRRTKKKLKSRCAFHLAMEFANEDGQVSRPGPLAIRSKYLLERLPMILGAMTPEDRIIVKITVPGVAEEFPLVSIGDLVRLVFRDIDTGVTAEVVAEVVDVVVKTEVVTFALPSPFQNLTKGSTPRTTYNCLPYLKALLHTQQHFVNANLVMQKFPRSLTQIHEAVEISQYGVKVMDRFRFDLRFGFLGGRGFDIIAAALGEKNSPNSKDKKQSKYEDEWYSLWQRALVPTRTAFKDISAASSRQELHASHKPMCWATSVNREQQMAVHDIVQRLHGKAPYIINGPAGTGKSTCVVEAIVQILIHNPYAKVLVCCPSDVACDVIALRLLPLLSKLPKVFTGGRDKITPFLVRINWWARKLASLPPELLACSSVDDRGVFSLPNHGLLKDASVVICQCFVAECLDLLAARGWSKFHFSHLFIDETSQAMECEALVPILKVGPLCSIILVGDPKQLGPTVRDPVAAKMGLGISIQERLLGLPLYKSEEYCVMTRLVANYRSNEALLSVPSNLFYGGSLQALASDEIAKPFDDCDLSTAGFTGFPLMLCNVANGREQNKLDTPSFYNVEECNAILQLIQGLLQCTANVKPDRDSSKGLQAGEIAVITPFRAQVLALRTVLRAGDLGNVNVGVVEDFQGQEAKVVLISTVLTKDHARWTTGKNDGNDDNGTKQENDTPVKKLGFMHDPKRFNVAITRAQALCVIVGHEEFLSNSGTYWAALMDHIQRNDGVIGGTNHDNDDGDDEYEEEDDIYGVADLMRRVEELQLLGAGCADHDLSYYYTDTPQWKVMLS